jgi:hypothetical protein
MNGRDIQDMPSKILKEKYAKCNGSSSQTSSSELNTFQKSTPFDIIFGERSVLAHLV